MSARLYSNADFDLTRIKPYGDHVDDGVTQVAFTLPVSCTPRARKAALALASKMGLAEAEVVHFEELLPGFTYFIVYGRNTHSVDFTLIEVDDDEQDVMDKAQVEAFIAANISRKIVVVGAATGTDTHTVGLDAILNMKGFHGSNGLEAYRGMQVYNLGGQVPNEVLVAKIIEVNADVVLVSQTVTQNNLHIHNMTELVDLLEAEGLRDRLILICGGPFLSDELAKELGYDRGYGRGAYAFHVATFIVREMARRLERLSNASASPP